MSRWVLAFVSIVTSSGGAVGCGGSPSPTPVPSGPIASIVAPRASEADVVVANVNGRPVWGSCVTEQAAAGAKDRKAALEQCIDFELLAQVAEQRGFGADPTVQEATRSAMVNELIASDFEARYQKPSDLGPALDRLLEKNAWRMHRPDLRTSTYVRAVVPPGSPPEVDATAKQVADRIVAELGTETGLLPAHVQEAADRAAVGTAIQIESQDVPQTPKTGSYEPPYLDALFSISDVGRISKPVRTKRGWDVVLWTGGLPPLESTREQIAEEAFPELRRAQFTTWLAEILKTSGIAVEIDPAAVALLGEDSR